MTMLFSQRVSLVLLAPTSSEMKVGHLWGQSCFKIYKGGKEKVKTERMKKERGGLTWTRVILSFLMKSFSFVNNWASEASLMTRETT